MKINILLIIPILTCVFASGDFNTDLARQILADPCEEFKKLSKNHIPETNRIARQAQVVTAALKPHASINNLPNYGNHLINSLHYDINDFKHNDEVSAKLKHSEERLLKRWRHLQNKKTHQIESNHIEENDNILIKNHFKFLARPKRVDLKKSQDKNDGKKIAECVKDLRNCALNACYELLNQNL